MKRLALLAATLWCATIAGAQELSKLTAPASPAFSILNFEPSAVMRPANAKSLAADILNSFDEEGKLLMNLGLEVAPYWLKSHPTLSRAEYLRPNIGQTFLQTLSLSAATVKDSATNQNRFGGGFRFRLLNGEPVPELSAASSELGARTTVVAIINGRKSVVAAGDSKQKAVDDIARALQRKAVSDTVVQSVRRDAAALEGDFGETPADVRLFLEALLQRRVEAYADLAKTVSALLYQRRGFILEFAGAAGYATRRTTDLDKIGFWANASYGVSADDLLTLTARFMRRNNDSLLNNVDAGVGYLKKTDRYNLSMEALVRHYRAEVSDRNASGQPIKRVEKETTWRVAFQGSYLLTKDVSINLSLGKDFAAPFISGSGFFSIMGLNFSIFHREPVPAVAQ